VRRLTGGEGKVVEKVQGLTTDSGMTGIEEERLRGGGSMGFEPVRRSSESGDGVLTVGMQEGNGKVARKLLRVDVVLVVSLWRAKRGRSVGTTVSPSGGGGEDRQCGVLGSVSARGWRRAS
jgi:hypothetical protein